MNTPADIAYRPRGRFAAHRVGAHSSSEVGGFGVFRDQAPFLRHPDARRIDIRATLRDPFGETHVRRFEQRRSVDVYALVDLSASMRFCGAANKLELVSRLCASLAYAATRIGDRFGLIGCDRAIRKDVFIPATRARATALRAADGLRVARCAGESARGLLEAAAFLGASRKIVLLISDFRWPAGLTERIFEAFAHHDTIPVVVADSIEETPPRWGLMELIDLETGRRRLMVMRPQLQSRWVEREAMRRKAIQRLAARYTRAPYFLRDSFDPVDLTRHLMAA